MIKLTAKCPKCGYCTPLTGDNLGSFELEENGCIRLYVAVTFVCDQCDAAFSEVLTDKAK